MFLIEIYGVNRKDQIIVMQTNWNSFYRKKYSRSDNNSLVVELKSMKIKQPSASPISLGISIHTGKVNPICDDT